MSTEMAGVQLTPETLPTITYREQPVITTALLAEFYGTTNENVRQNFQRNEERFVDGVHFFKVQGEELTSFRARLADLQPSNSHLQIDPMVRHLMLWTRRGSARHAKMLETDRAWEVFERLEEAYFDRPRRPPEQSVSERLRVSAALTREARYLDSAKTATAKAVHRDQLLSHYAALNRDPPEELVNFAVGRDIGSAEVWQTIMMAFLSELQAGRYPHPYQLVSPDSDEGSLAFLPSHVYHYFRKKRKLAGILAALPSDRLFKRSLIGAGVVVNKEASFTTPAGQRQTHAVTVSLGALRDYGIRIDRPL